MIKLTVLVARNPALSVEEFHEAWRAHGRMIAEDPALRRWIRRYEQHHRVPEDGRNGGGFDGLALQWFDSYRHFVDFVESPEYVERLQPDEARLLDMERLVVLFTDEAEVLIP